MRDIPNKLKNLFKNILRSKLIWIPVAVAFAFLAYRYRGILVAASVNGQPVSRLSVISMLEKEGGKQVLDNLITNSLILQEAKKQNVSVNLSEIQSEEDKIQAQLKTSGSDLDTALASQGMTKKDLEDQIKLKIMVEKMAVKNVSVTDKDIEDYFNANKASYPKGTKLDGVKDQIKSTLERQKTSEAISNWITNLRKEAKINYFVNY